MLNPYQLEDLESERYRSVPKHIKTTDQFIAWINRQNAFKSHTERFKQWLSKKMLKLIVHWQKDSKTLKFARQELVEFNPIKHDDPIVRELQELLAVLEVQNKPNHSRACKINLLKKLAFREVISPLTGDDNEWQPFSDKLVQNRRCLQVFKDMEGVAYDMDFVRVIASVSRHPEYKPQPFRLDENGEETTEHLPVEFPYTPHYPNSENNF